MGWVSGFGLRFIRETIECTRPHLIIDLGLVVEDQERRSFTVRGAVPRPLLGKCQLLNMYPAVPSARRVHVRPSFRRELSMIAEIASWLPPSPTQRRPSLLDAPSISVSMSHLAVFLFGNRIRPAYMLRALNRSFVALIRIDMSIARRLEACDIAVPPAPPTTLNSNSGDDNMADGHQSSSTPIPCGAEKLSAWIDSFPVAPCFGHAIVKSIDLQSATYHLITPLSAAELRNRGVNALFLGTLQIPLCFLRGGTSDDDVAAGAYLPYVVPDCAPVPPKAKKSKGAAQGED